MHLKRKLTISLHNLGIFFMFCSLIVRRFLPQKSFDTENGFNMCPLMYTKSSAKFLILVFEMGQFEYFLGNWACPKSLSIRFWFDSEGM